MVERRTSGRVLDRQSDLLPKEFSPNIFMGDEEVMVDVLTCNTDQCCCLGVPLDTKKSGMVTVAIGVTKEQKILFASIVPPLVREAMFLEKSDDEPWSKTKARVYIRFLRSQPNSTVRSTLTERELYGVTYD